MQDTAILLISCPDQKGIIWKVTEFIAKNNGNIINADQHIDCQSEVFFMRLEWDLKDFKIERKYINEAFAPIASKFSMKWELKFSMDIQNVAIFVSKQDHCLHDLLYRFRAGELKGKPKVIISNHTDCKIYEKLYNIPFYHIPKSKDNQLEAEEKELELLDEHKIGTVILARYMRILSSNFVKKFKNRIINIHHSFLPAFAGPKPYHRAYERGVKIIGASSHYVTEELDSGPIIEQDVIRISHRDTIEDIVRKGKDLEKLVLSRAVKWHLENKILVYNNKTVIFE